VKQVLTFDFFTLYTTIPLSKRNDILKELVQLCLIINKRNRMANVDTHILSYFGKKTKALWFCQKVLWNWYHQISRGFDLQHMLCLVDVYFNRQSAYLWGQTVLLFSPTCSFIRMTKEMISIYQLWTFQLYVATFQQRLHMEYISLSCTDILELVVPIRISLI
jgi:hypothetical protein